MWEKDTVRAFMDIHVLLKYLSFRVVCALKFNYRIILEASLGTRQKIELHSALHYTLPKRFICLS